MVEHCNHSYLPRVNHSFASVCNLGYMETISERIKRLRDEAKLSQEQLGEAVGVSRVAVTKWENGQVANMKLANLLGMCKAFGGITAEELITGRKPHGKNGNGQIRVAEHAAAPYSHRDKAIRKIITLLEAMSEDGKLFILQSAEMAAKQYPKADPKANAS